jgi:biopolymer transport protein ExbD
MGASTSNNDSGTISEINITPFVDVVLVLLIIFMVTAKLVFSPTKAKSLELPKAATADRVENVFAITVQKDESLLLDGKAVDEAGLVAAAKDQHARHPLLKAVIQADGDVPHRRIIHLMDLLAKADLSQIAFAVQMDANAGDPHR